MKIHNDKVYKRQRRHRRVRQKVVGSASTPRLSVFRSANHIYAQLIDDATGRTIAAASTLKLASPAGGEKGRKMVQAGEVGRLIAEAAKEKGIQKVAFDRGGYKYHGRVAAVADAARKNGLEF